MNQSENIKIKLIAIINKDEYSWLILLYVLKPPKTEKLLFVCVEVLRPSQPNGVMSNAVSLPNHTFTGQA